MHDQREAGQPLLDLGQRRRGAAPGRPRTCRRRGWCRWRRPGCRSPIRCTNSSASSGSVRWAFFSSTCDVLLHAAQLAQFRLHRRCPGRARVDDLPGDADVLLERLAGGVDHDRGVEAALDAVVAGVVSRRGPGARRRWPRGRSRRRRGSWPRACACRRTSGRPWRSG